MAIQYLEISHLRNLKHVCLKPTAHINVFIGKNGSGKTSLLEAIHVLGTGRSFRTSNTSKLINFGETQFLVFGRLLKDRHVIPVGISKSRQELKIKIANQPANSASQLAEQLAVQIINPDAHKLLEEGPRYRRRFIEWGVFHVEPSYFSLWQKCRHVLKQRNAALKQKVSLRELQHWDEVLVENTERVDRQRREYVSRLQVYLNTLLELVADFPPVTMKLDSGWPTDQTLDEALADSRDVDYEKGFTRYGPHRMDLKIKVSGVAAKEVVSRGQQKLLTALMKIAQVQMLKAARPRSNIVLLVDDLPAELDAGFRQLLMNMIAEIDVNAFITATDIDYIPLEVREQKKNRMFHVEHGDIRQLDN